MLKWFGFKDKSTSQQQQPQHSQQQPSSSISQDDIINDESSRIRAYSTPRVLVLQESDRQSGLLADTDARRRPKERALAQHRRASQLDGRLLHEMLFGAVPLSMNGVSTKLHLIPNTRQMLMTKLCRVQFLPPPLHSADDHHDLLQHSAPHVVSAAPSTTSSPGLMLLHQHHQHHLYHSHQHHQHRSDHQNAFKLTFAVALLFDNVLPPRRATAAGDDGDAPSTAANSDAAALADDDVDENDSIHLRQFIESHSALFDFHLNTLCRSVVTNLRHRYDRQCQEAGRQVAPLFELGALQHCPHHALAVRRLSDELYALANRQRLHTRSVTATPSSQAVGHGAAFALLGEERRAEAFLRSLRHLARYDSSTNDFFLSTLVTALLTYNHSWLNVLEHTSLLGGSRVKPDARRRAENTLTHQLRGLFGHWHGDPAKQEHTCRTVVRGADPQVVENVLVIVGYFVRGVELLVSELQPPQPPLFRDAAAAIAPLADSALQGAHERDIGADLPHASLPPVIGHALGLTGDERLGDLRYSMVGGVGAAPPSTAAENGDDNNNNNNNSGAPQISDAFSALAVSGIGVDQSLRQVRRAIALQLRSTVDLPLMPTLAGSSSRSRLPRVAFCLLADVDSKMCELLSCSALQQDGAGTGILAAYQHRQYQLAMRAAEANGDDGAAPSAGRPRSRSLSSVGAGPLEYDSVGPETTEADEMQRFGVHRSRLLPSEHIATTLGELREVAALGVSATMLCAYMDQRIALLVASARVVALQMHDPSVLAAAAAAAAARSEANSSDGGSFKMEAELRTSTASQLMTAEEAAVAAGVAPTDVPVVATIARLCGARWWC